MDKSQGRRQLEELSHLFDTWGGDPKRWPVRVRARIASLSTGQEAARLLAEAAALDRLIDQAGDAPARIEGERARELADRIVAAALAETATTAGVNRGRAEVIELPRRVRSVPVARGLGSAWSTAALLAASLLVGIYLGGTVNMLPVLQEVAEVVGISTVVDPSVAALGDDLSEEDAL